MNTQEKDSLVALLKNNIGIINEIVKNELGVNTEFEINPEQRWNGKWIVCIEEKNHEETKRQMTATPLLAQLFSDAYLYIHPFLFNEVLGFEVNINYDHNFNSGSNGCSLMRFSINLDTNTVEVIK